MRAGYRFGQLVEQRFLHLCELRWIHDLEDVFYFIQEHDLFGAVHLGPVAKKTKDNLFCQRSILLQKLNNAVCELWVIHAQALHFVQGNEHSSEEELVLLLQWQSKTINDGSQNLEKFSNAIESLGFVDELEEDIVDGATNVGAEVQEFSIYAVQRCL